MTIFWQQAEIQTNSFNGRGFLNKNVRFYASFWKSNELFLSRSFALNHWIHTSPRRNGEQSYHSHTGSLTLKLTGKFKPFSRGLWNGLWSGDAEERPECDGLGKSAWSAHYTKCCAKAVHGSLEMEAPCFCSHTLFIKWAFVRLIVKINAAQWSTSSLTLHLMGKFQNWTSN